MSFNNKLVRHWFGFAHGWLAMLAVAWIYEGKCIGQQQAYFVLPLVMGIISGILVMVTGARLIEEIEK